MLVTLAAQRRAPLLLCQQHLLKRVDQSRCCRSSSLRTQTTRLLLQLQHQHQRCMQKISRSACYSGVCGAALWHAPSATVTAMGPLHAHVCLRQRCLVAALAASRCSLLLHPRAVAACWRLRDSKKQRARSTSLLLCCNEVVGVIRVRRSLRLC